MSPTAAKAGLSSALEEFRRRFDAAKGVWDDEARRRFEEDFIAPLEQKVRAATLGLDRLAEIMSAAKRDCGDEA